MNSLWICILMALACSACCVRGAAAAAAGRGATPKKPAPRALPTNWQRFLPDNSYMEREYACTEAEKGCFAYGRLLHWDGSCYAVREQGPCKEGEIFRVNKTDATRAELPVLRGTCAKQCVGPRRPLAASGECRTADYVESEVCRSEWGLHSSVDIFGEWVCKCLNNSCFRPAPPSPPPPPPPPPPPSSPAASSPPPPSAASEASPSPLPSPSPDADTSPSPAPGPPLPTPAPLGAPAPAAEGAVHYEMCPAPDLSKPTPVPYYDDRLALFGFWVPCSEAEHGCLKRGRVRAGGSCHALRSRGNCASGEELVLDAEALHYPYNPARARLQTKCVARRCPDGGFYVPADSRCYAEHEVRTRLCAGRLPLKDEFGGWGCWRHLAAGADLASTRREAGRCELPPSAAWY